MTTERKNASGGRWADTKDMERQASNSNVVGTTNGEVDESTMPLNPKKPDNKSSVKKGKYGRSKNGYLCQVLLLDGNEFEVEVPASANGQVLVDKVCDHISLAERDYFSLSYRDRTDVKFWLDHSKKISKQIGNGPYVFAFEVKFYPTEPESMREDFTRYLLFLQLRTDILTGRLPCSFVTHALLASYAIQSDMGDYETDSHGSGFEYLLNTEFAPNQGEELLEKVAELHRTHRGLMPEEAELEYLNNAKKLAMYGIELHQAKDKEGDVTIGVCASGLLVYRGKLRVHRFSWPKILKIAYKRNKFTIYVRPGEFEQTRNKLVYELVSYTMAKKLWKIAVEHHGFFRLKEPEGPLRAMFPLFGSKFRYSGRTQYQSRSDPKDGSRPTVRVDRSASSRRFAPTRPMDTSGPTFSTERKEEVITASDMPVTTLDLRNRTKRNVPYASVEEDPNLTGMDEGQVSLLRNPGSPNYNQVGWAKPKGAAGYGGPTYQGTPWDQQGFQLCDQNGRPLRAGHNGPIFIKYGTPIVQSEKQLSDMYGNPIPNNYDGKVYDREGNPIADSPAQLYNRYGNPINWPSHRGPVFGIYGKPQMQDIYDGEHKPVRPTHAGPVYDSYGNPCVPVEIAYGRNMRPAGYDKPGYQLCDEYGYPIQPNHEGQILIKYGIPIARGTYELCDINGIPITRDYDGPVYDRWGNLLAPGIENLYDEYGIPVYLTTHDGPVYGRYGMPILVDLYDKDGRLVRPGHRGQVYDVHRQILIPLEVLDDGSYGDSTARRRGPPTLEKPPSRVSGMSIRDSKGNLISTSPYPLAEGEDNLPPYADRDKLNPYSVTTTTRTTMRTYRGTDGTLVTEHKTEKDGVIETRIEKKTTIVTQVDETNDIDFDKLLSAAIMGATELNPDMSVEKIEIHTETQ